MNRFDELFKDYALEAVPADHAVPGWRISLIYIGVGLTLPAFLTAATLGLALGFVPAILCTLLSALILAGLAGVTGYIGGATRLSTYRISRIAFGRMGAKFANLVMAVTTFGWFGVTASFFAAAAQALAAEHFGLEIARPVWVVLGVVLMTATALFGFRGLDKLSLVAVPLLLALLTAAVCRSLSDMAAADIFAVSGTAQMSFGVTTSMMIGTWMVGVTLLPDLTRYARSAAQGAWGGVLSFVPGMPLVFIPAMIPALVTGEADLVKTLTAFGWTVWALMIVILASWSTNDNNLYAASLSLASVFEKFRKWKITLIAGGLGGLIAVFGTMDMFIPFLIGLGILIPPVAGIYSAAFAISFKSGRPFAEDSTAFHWPAFAAWAAGSLTAYATQPADAAGLGLMSLSTVPALDAIIVAAITYALCVRLTARREKA